MPRCLAAARRIRRFSDSRPRPAPRRPAPRGSGRELDVVSLPMSALAEPSGAPEFLPEGPIRVGSDAHKALFCRTLLDTFDPYKPAVIDWPKLDDEARDRLVSLPIWDIAVQTEGRARLNVAAYAASHFRSPAAQGDRTQRLRGGPAQAGALEPRHGLWHRARARAALRRAGRPGMGLHGHRIQRVHRQLLRLRTFRIGQAFRFLSRGAGRHVRAGHSGRRRATSCSSSIGPRGIAGTCRFGAGLSSN